MAQETVKERLIKFLKYKKLGQNKFELMCGLSTGYISHLAGRPSYRSLPMILARFPELSEVWLMTGQGEMLVTEKEAKDVNMENFCHIPFVNQYAYAGYLAGYADPEYIKTLKSIPAVIKENEARNLLAFEVRGDSMDDGTRDAICDGDIVVVSEVEQALVSEIERYLTKWRFVIVHEDGILIKKVSAINHLEGTMTIHSLNPLYRDRVLTLSSVKKIFRIIKLERNEM